MDFLLEVEPAQMGPSTHTTLVAREVRSRGFGNVHLDQKKQFGHVCIMQVTIGLLLAFFVSNIACQEGSQYLIPKCYGTTIT